MRTRRYTIVFLVELILCVQISSFVQAQDTIANNALATIMQQYPVMGLSVAVVKNNQVVYAQSIGWKDSLAKTRLSNTDIFRIASISKSFSATAVMQLIEKRQLTLESDISELIGFTVRNPKFPDKPITLKMVLSHRSSINDSQGYFSLDVINPSKNPDWAKSYNTYAPDSGYMYCNLNYNLTGAIIEKYSGERFDTYIKKHILDPLGLYGGYNVDALDRNRFASIYEYNRDSLRFFPSPNAYASRRADMANYIIGYTAPIFSPTGGMKISATDLAKYMIMHSQLGKYNGQRIIRRKSAKRMQTIVSVKEQYGLGLSKTTQLIEGESLIGHTGSAYGLYSAMFFEPDKKFGFVVISNGCDIGYAKGFNVVIRQTINQLYNAFIKEAQ